MSHSQRLLLGPGPSNPYPEVIEALTRPVLGHLDPEFLVVLDETCERLRSALRTRNELTLPVRVPALRAWKRASSTSSNRETS